MTPQTDSGPSPVETPSLYRLVATCGAGTEELVEGEVKRWKGERIQRQQGGVSWSGTLESAYQACLWSRVASRVLLEIAQFPAGDEESLYHRAGSLDWQEHMTADTTFAVDCTVSSSLSMHSKFAALRVKDAIVDQFRERVGRRPNVDTDQPGVRINVYCSEDLVVFSLDLSGESLHRRGYRAESGPAPLKENLAAALVMLSGWYDGSTVPGPLVDPMCGSGTLLIEAALLYGDSAPGLDRTSFGFLGWRQHDPALWNRLVEEALQREQAGAEREWPPLLGRDADPALVAMARKNIARAGLTERINVERGDFSSLQPSGKERGMVLTNLPYGERLAEKEEIHWLYRAVGRITGERFPGWRLGVLIGDPERTDSFGMAWSQRHKLFNGPLSCRFLVTTVDPQDQTGRFVWQLNRRAPGQEAADLFNRLRKNFQRFGNWAQRNGISCFRLYDRDLPEYNVSVDIYGKHIHLQEYAPPSSVSEDLARSRFALVVQVIKELFGVRSDRLFCKRRQRQRGKGQYQKRTSKGRLIEVREGQCAFLVNLADYLDTGLFLDHRPLRQKLQGEAEGKHFLNLFGYTGTATVHAAVGGALSTTTVDLSGNYLQWAAKNLALNGCAQNRHSLVAADCLTWLAQETKLFDLILLDPPTFSNTRKHQRVFDIQRDHPQLLDLTMARLAPGGTLYFSTNYRKFRLSDEVAGRYELHDISGETIPYDFSRTPNIHRCWEVRP